MKYLFKMSWDKSEVNLMNAAEWIRCVYGNKTRLQIREDTERKNFPLYYPKCKQESLLETGNLQVSVVKSVESKT